MLSLPSIGSIGWRMQCIPADGHSTSRDKACSPAWDSALPPWQSPPPDTSHQSQAPSSKKRSTSPSSSTHYEHCAAERHPRSPLAPATLRLDCNLYINLW